MALAVAASSPKGTSITSQSTCTSLLELPSLVTWDLAGRSVVLRRAMSGQHLCGEKESARASAQAESLRVRLRQHRSIP